MSLLSTFATRRPGSEGETACMIFDGHAYCFPSTAGDGGFDDPEDFRRHLQQAMATHHQPVWRARDLAPGDASTLIDADNWPSLNALKQSDFHAAANGRFEWTSDGERYFKQYFPPSITDMSYPPDRLVAEMDYAGVSRALLHRTPYLGIGNEFIADCVARYPGQTTWACTYAGMGDQHGPGGLARQRQEMLWQDGGLVGLQFLPPQLDLYNYDRPLGRTGVPPVLGRSRRIGDTCLLLAQAAEGPG